MTLTKEDLLAISQLLDEKLDEKLESKLEEKLESKLEEKLESKLEEKLESKLEEKLESKLDEKLESKLEEKLESKLQPIRDDIRMLKLQNENVILPRLQTIESCYLSTYERYRKGIDQLDAMQEDIDVIKMVVTGHSEKLRQMA